MYVASSALRLYMLSNKHVHSLKQTKHCASARPNLPRKVHTLYVEFLVLKQTVKYKQPLQKKDLQRKNNEIRSKTKTRGRLGRVRHLTCSQRSSNGKGSRSPVLQQKGSPNCSSKHKQKTLHKSIHNNINIITNTRPVKCWFFKERARDQIHLITYLRFHQKLFLQNHTLRDHVQDEHDRSLP